MISMHILIAFSAFFLLLILKINNKSNFIQSSRLLLRLAQVVFIIALIVPLGFKLLPLSQRPALPLRFTFPAEEIANSLNKQVFLPRSTVNVISTKSEKANGTSFISINKLTFELLLKFFYLALIIFGIARFFVNWYEVKTLLKDSRTIKKLGRVTIALSENITVPFSVLQGGSAWVVLPSSMLALRKDFLIALNHEIQHHRQKDTAWIIFIELMGTILFVNPAFYLWRKIFSELQEFSCDEALINGQRVSLRDYGDCLVRVAEAALENRSRLAGTASMALMFGNPKKINSTLIRRIKMFQQHLSSRFQTGRFMVLGIASIFLTIAIAYGATAKIESASNDEINKGVLVVDSEIQKIAENALTKAVARFKATSGFALVSDPKTGRLLAVANTITIPKNNLSEHWALKLRMEPASVMKALIAAKTVDLNLTKYNEVMDCHNGEMEYAGNIYRDWKPFDKLSVRDMVVHSSNLCALEVVKRLGSKSSLNLLRDFGFGKSGTTENFPEARYGQVIPVGDENNVQFTASMGMGYSIHITPLEMVQAFGAIANGGNLMKPLMANEPDSNIKVIRRVLSESTANETKSVLRDVLIRGTASNSESKIYNLAGKTGSASSPWLGNDNESGGESNVGSFVGFGPTENPKVIIYVAIYEPKDHKDHSAHGSAHAAPVFREIAEKVLEQMHVSHSVSKN